MRLIPRRETIGYEDCPIMFRWELVNLGPRVGKLMLHRFLPDRDDSHPHDHPASFWTFVLRGGYDDMVPCGRCDGLGVEQTWALLCPACDGRGVVVGERMRAGMLRHRDAEHTHITRMGPDGAWTIVWMGAKEREWGFRVAQGWIPWRTYVAARGFGERC